MSEQARELWKAAVKAQETGETALATTLFRRLLEEHPESFEAIDAVFILATMPRRADPLRAISSFVRAPRSTGNG